MNSRFFTLANYRAAIQVGWNDRDADIVAASHIMAFLLGAVEPGGEWRTVPDPDVQNVTAAEVAFLTNFEEVSRTGALICTMGAVNHYSINHTTGQGKLQGFALKVAKVLGIEYPSDRTASAAEKRKQASDMIYAAAHPVSKRNMLFTLDPSIPSLSATWAPGAPRPANGGADEFLSVRTGGVPAGARKVYVTMEACKRIASNGLLVVMPGVKSVKKMASTLREVNTKGCASHVGAAYYLRHTAVQPHKVDQNRDSFHRIQVCAGAYLSIIAPGSTLAGSPAFAGTEDEARAEFGDWVAECQAYAQAINSRVSSGIATVLGKFSAGVTGIESVEQIKEEFDNVSEENELERKSVARRLIRAAKKVSMSLLNESD